jgi:2-keto-3-deoxy-L-rhamnonate aldolase RhmA
LALNIPGQLDHPDFTSACSRIVQACSNHGKQAGILLKDSRRVQDAIAAGFRFIAVGMDVGFLKAGIDAALLQARSYFKAREPSSIFAASSFTP